MRVHVRANEAADALHAQAKDLYQVGKVLEESAKDSTLWYGAYEGGGGKGCAGA